MVTHATLAEFSEKPWNDIVVDERGNARADESYETSVPGVFACGDARRGASLTVWAIAEGRRCARAIDARLMKGDSELARVSVDESAREVGFELLPPGDAVTPVG